MPWKTKSDYFSFKQEAINQHAPTVSGVYGLFNFHHQILIEGADNIRVALLHRLTNTNSRIGRLQPTGFIFEPCAPEIRERRVQELIREYSPLLQPRDGVGLTALWRSLRRPDARAFHPELCATSKPASVTAAKVRGTKSQVKSAGHPRFERKRFDIAGAACAMIFLSVGSVALLPQLKNMFHSYVLDRSSLLAESPKPVGNANSRAAKTPAFQVAVAAGQPGRDIIGDTLTTDAEAEEPATDSADVVESETADALTSSTSAAADGIAQTPRSPASTTPRPPEESSESHWTVQVLATTDKQVARDWMRRLQVKGYDAFVTEAFVRGQMWQRVRVGNLATRRAAEALQNELAAKESVRETFIARIERSQHLLSLNRQ